MLNALMQMATILFRKRLLLAVTAGWAAVGLCFIVLLPFLRHSECQVSHTKLHDIVITRSPSQSSLEPRRGLIAVRITNLGRQRRLVYASDFCLSLRLPETADEYFGFKQGDRISSRPISEANVISIAPLSSIEIEFHAFSSFVKPHTVWSVGTYVCQVIYDDHTINIAADAEHWHRRSEIGRVAGPLITIRVGWLGTSIIN